MICGRVLVRDRFCRVSARLDESLDRETGQEKLEKMRGVLKRAEDSLLQLRITFRGRSVKPVIALPTRKAHQKVEGETMVDLEAATDRTGGVASATSCRSWSFD